MTAALEGGEWSAARPGRTLPPGKTRYPFYRRLGWPQGRSGLAENLDLTGIRSRTVQLVVSRYTDYATHTHTHTHTHTYIYILCVCVCARADKINICRISYGFLVFEIRQRDALQSQKGRILLLFAITERP